MRAKPTRFDGGREGNVDPKDESHETAKCALGCHVIISNIHVLLEEEIRGVINKQSQEDVTTVVSKLRMKASFEVSSTLYHAEQEAHTIGLYRKANRSQARVLWSFQQP